ncbi:MAG: ACP S-malonyltransferase [Bacteroidota bacterium]|nr:ACP S-malonyltransferase [Bacteroidota bacterium]
MKAFLFPGQGSQAVGMARDLFERNEAARAVMERANTVLGFDLTDIMFGSGSEETADTDKAILTRTQNTQPALFVHSMAVMTALPRHASTPDMVAGHSLGEYSALAAAGVISFEEGLCIVRLRGELMAQAGDIRPGAMAAILGMEDADVEALCSDASGEGIVQPANFNSPGQIVISGDVEAVEKAVELAPDRGARRVLKLPVSGAFHSPLMDFARDGLAEALDSLPIHTPTCPVYLNVTAAPTTDPEEIRARLVEQLMSPVRWAQSLTAMQADGASRFVEIGAGKVLSGLVKRTLGRDVETVSLSTAADLETL